eukprot:158617-Chlamydomonas_euryale.AAC.1
MMLRVGRRTQGSWMAAGETGGNRWGGGSLRGEEGSVGRWEPGERRREREAVWVRGEKEEVWGCGGLRGDQRDWVNGTRSRGWWCCCESELVIARRQAEMEDGGGGGGKWQNKEA